MYGVDVRDRVIECPDLPQASVGAPAPLLLADEGRLLLAYDLERLPGAGAVVHVVDPVAQPTPAALVEFHRPRAVTLGPPGGETLPAHPLAARGLRWYAAQEVVHSSWIRQLERIDRAHPRHDPARFARLRHFVITFHDSTFECVAEGFAATICTGGRADALADMQRRIGIGAPSA